MLLGFLISFLCYRIIFLLKSTKKLTCGKKNAWGFPSIQERKTKLVHLVPNPILVYINIFLSGHVIYDMALTL